MNTMNLHPEWGCLAPAPSFLRTVRTALIATVVGATAGGGVVLSLVDRSAGQTSVAERTLVRPVSSASTPLSAPQTAQPSPNTSDQSETRQVLREDSQLKDLATNDLHASSPAGPTIVAASDDVRMVTGADSAKAAVAPSPTLQARQKRIVQGARHKDVLSPSRQSQRSSPDRTEPNTFQKLLTGLTAAVEHVWPLATSTANPTSRAHGNRSSAAAT
jgi:hypothetical protein